MNNRKKKKEKKNMEALLDRDTYYNSRKDDLKAQRERLEHLQALIDIIDAGKKINKTQANEIENIRIKMKKLEIIDDDGNITEFYRKER